MTDTVADIVYDNIFESHDRYLETVQPSFDIKLNVIDAVIELAESENRLAINNYKDEDLVLVNKINVVSSELTQQIDKPGRQALERRNVPICPQIEIEPLHKLRTKIVKNNGNNRLRKSAHYINLFIRNYYYPNV